MSLVKSIKKTRSRQKSSTKQNFAMAFVEGKTPRVRKHAGSPPIATRHPVSTDLSEQLRANLIQNVEATANRTSAELALWEM